MSSDRIFLRDNWIPYVSLSDFSRDFWSSSTCIAWRSKYDDWETCNAGAVNINLCAFDRSESLRSLTEKLPLCWPQVGSRLLILITNFDNENSQRRCRLITLGIEVGKLLFKSTWSELDSCPDVHAADMYRYEWKYETQLFYKTRVCTEVCTGLQNFVKIKGFAISIFGTDRSETAWQWLIISLGNNWFM